MWIPKNLEKRMHQKGAQSCLLHWTLLRMSADETACLAVGPAGRKGYKLPMLVPMLSASKSQHQQESLNGIPLCPAPPQIPPPPAYFLSN